MLGPRHSTASNDAARLMIQCAPRTADWIQMGGSPQLCSHTGASARLKVKVSVIGFWGRAHVEGSANAAGDFNLC